MSNSRRVIEDSDQDDIDFVATSSSSAESNVTATTSSNGNKRKKTPPSKKKSDSDSDNDSIDSDDSPLSTNIRLGLGVKVINPDTNLPFARGELKDGQIVWDQVPNGDEYHVRTLPFGKFIEKYSKLHELFEF